MTVRVEAGFHHEREVLGLRACLVDGDEEGGKTLEVHQQVVDQVFDAPVVMLAEQVAQRHAVLSAQG